MDTLPLIATENLEREVEHLLHKADAAQKQALEKFGRNVIDPFSALFEISGFDLDHATWRKSETARQAQKTLQNHIGAFHQNLLGYAIGWQDLKTGGVVDLKSESAKIIAEVKNKYSTISGGKLSELYYSLEKLVSPKASIYKGYTAYYVTVIPRKPERKNVPFTPSDKESGGKCPTNELIREIDGVSFYDLAFAGNGVLSGIYARIPDAIESIATKTGKFHSLSTGEVAQLQAYFAAAFPV